MNKTILLFVILLFTGCVQTNEYYLARHPDFRMWCIYQKINWGVDLALECNFRIEETELRILRLKEFLQQFGEKQ